MLIFYSFYTLIKLTFVVVYLFTSVLANVTNEFAAILIPESASVIARCFKDTTFLPVARTTSE